MPALENQKHEAFAQALARGQPVAKAFVKAGFKPNRGNASRLKANESICHRLAELREARERQASTPPDMNGRDDKTGQFQKGIRPVGRPKGSRNKLGETFIADLHEEWQRSGAKALRQVAETDPAAFVKVTASVLPRLIDTSLKIDVTLFQECRDFGEAFRLAKQVIGANDDDDPLLIEANKNNIEEELGLSDMADLSLRSTPP